MSQSQVAFPSVNARALPTAERNNRPWIILAVVLLLAAALAASRTDYYTPGSDLGYNMGLIGGLMMLALLLYPLRKHVRFLSFLGHLKHWFRLHMVFGIAGPALVLFHSKFSFGSLNAAVALFCMLLVAGSGIIGRFIYRRIHHGLYGQHATLKELREAVGASDGEVKSRFHFAPAVEQRLKEYGDMALSPSSGVVSGALKFMTLGIRARFAHFRVRRDLKIALASKGLKRSDLTAHLDAADKLIWSYLRVAQKAAQFTVYERLFSLWHILHTPFVFMLAISGVVHVIAVHMY